MNIKTKLSLINNYLKKFTWMDETERAQCVSNFEDNEKRQIIDHRLHAKFEKLLFEALKNDITIK